VKTDAMTSPESMSDDELSAAVAVECAGWTFHPPPSRFPWDDASGCPTYLDPQFAVSPNDVLPLLEKREWSAKGGLGLPITVRVLDSNYREHIATAPTFARAACIALLKAKRSET
jgi:hypothetical protein